MYLTLTKNWHSMHKARDRDKYLYFCCYFILHYLFWYQSSCSIIPKSCIFNRYDMPWECWLQVDCYVYKMIYQIPSKKCISDTYTISIVTLYAIEDPRYANTSIPCLLYCCIIWGALTVSVEVLVDCCIQCIPIYMLLILLIFLCRVHSVAPYQTAKYRRHYPR